MLNLGTHVLLHPLAGTLTPTERRRLASDSWSISAVVLWDIGKLAQLKRISLDIDSAEPARALTRIQVWPLDLAVCRVVRKPDLSGDPGDEIIAAISMVHHVPVLTPDRGIHRCKVVQLGV